MWNLAHRNRAVGSVVRVVLPIAATLGLGTAAYAEQGEWTLRLDVIQMDAYGHDQHVLTVREIDVDPTPQIDDKTAVSLDTESGLAYRGDFQYTRSKWGAGVGFMWFVTSQDTNRRTAAADGAAGAVDAVVFQVADNEFTSTDPAEILFYDVLEDTDLQMWTVDFYGIRKLTDRPDSGIRLQYGLRLGDFDNDYRAVVGVEGVAGSQLDASSNYDLMMGPHVGLAGNLQYGKNRIEGYLGQSVLLGSVELTGMSREFTGPFGATPAFFAMERIRLIQDVAIPVSELRLQWSYRVSKTVALGVGAQGSVWRDVPVPPGVIPVEGGDDALHENTVVLFGLSGAVEITF